LLARAQDGDPPVKADKAEKPEKPDPKKNKAPDLLRAADAKIAKAKSLSYSAKVRGVGALGTRSPEASGSLTLLRDDKAAPGFKFLAKGPAKWSGKEIVSREFTTSFDGKIVRSLHDRDKKVAEATWGTSTDLMDEGAGWLSSWILKWKELVTERFNEPENMVPSRVEGIAEVGGVACDVVYVDYSELSDRQLFDVWWYLGKDDSLPRRVDMHLVGVGGDGFTITEISNLEVNPAVEADKLALAVPEGFTVEKAKEPEARQGVRVVKAAGPQVGDAAPDWTLKDSDGKEHSLSEYRGKVVVMDFWATWCPPCRAAMPGIQKVHEKYKAKGVVVLGMDCWESGDAPGYMKENGITYGLIMKADEAAKAYGVSGIPTLYVIGPDGKVAYRTVGFEGEEALETAIKAKLAP
jgi:thiol-disulfide isomerase/thioredoxin